MKVGAGMEKRDHAQKQIPQRGLLPFLVECSDEGTLVKRRKLDSHVRSELQPGLST